MRAAEPFCGRRTRRTVVRYQGGLTCAVPPRNRQPAPPPPTMRTRPTPRAPRTRLACAAPPPPRSVARGAPPLPTPRRPPTDRNTPLPPASTASPPRAAQQVGNRRGRWEQPSGVHTSMGPWGGRRAERETSAHHRGGQGGVGWTVSKQTKMIGANRFGPIVRKRIRPPPPPPKKKHVRSAHHRKFPSAAPAAATGLEAAKRPCRKSASTCARRTREGGCEGVSSVEGVSEVGVRTTEGSM